MQYRVGKCGSCGATFKVPATFQGDKAKCKSCGTGVVEIGPVNGPVNGTVNGPAQDPAQDHDEGFEEYVPSGRKREGLSMKEQLRARGAGSQPKPVPARRVAPAAAARQKPAAKPAARAERGAQRPAVEATAASRTAARAGGRRSGAAARRRRGADGDGDDPVRGGHRRPSKEKSPAPAIAALVVIVAAVFGVWKFVLQDADGGGTPTGPTVAAAEGTPGVGTAELDSDAETTQPDPAQSEEGLEPEDGSPGQGDPATEEPPAPKAPKVADPSSVDLTLLDPFGPVDDTSEGEWAEIQELVDKHIDMDAGAAGNRAGQALERYGKQAFPAIVNAMLKLDYSTEEGFRNGDLLQKRLQFIANGRNVGWKYSTEPSDELFNKKAVKKLHEVWSKAETDLAYWLFYSKQDKVAEEQEGLSDEDLDALDDLDDLDDM